MKRELAKPGQKKWDIRFMTLAKEAASWSKDPSTCVGSVAVSDSGSPLSLAYNGFPRGVDDSHLRLTNRQEKYSLMCHSEMNLIYNSNYNCVSLNGSSVYVYGLPVCSECAKGLIQVGVKRVVMSMSKETSQHWADSFKLTQHLFTEAGVEYYFLDNKND